MSSRMDLKPLAQGSAHRRCCHREAASSAAAPWVLDMVRLVEEVKDPGELTCPPLQSQPLSPATGGEPPTPEAPGWARTTPKCKSETPANPALLVTVDKVF